jgi:hypothetical protein
MLHSEYKKVSRVGFQYFRWIHKNVKIPIKREKDGALERENYWLVSSFAVDGLSRLASISR